MAEMTYKVLAMTVMGGEQWLAFVKSPGTSEQVEATLKVVAVLTLVPKFLWEYIPIPNKDKAMENYAIQGEIATKIIQNIRDTNEKGDSLMHFLVHHDSQLTNKEITSEVMGFVMAGHETTSNTLSFALVALAIKPEIQTKARNEIISIIGKGNSVLNYEHINQLHYIWAIFREALRMFPTVPFTFRPCKEDTKVGKYDVKKGTRVFVNMYNINRNDKYFKDALEFIPERWLNDNTTIETLKNHDITRNFGGGLRVCIGKRFSEEESILLLSMLILNFEISLLNNKDNNIKICDLPTKTNVTMSFKNPTGLKFTPI